MALKNLWEKHVDHVARRMIVLLETEQYGEEITLKVNYSLCVIIGEVEKFFLLSVLLDVWESFWNLSGRM